MMRLFAKQTRRRLRYAGRLILRREVEWALDMLG
jgi:hypothetical protein